MQGKAKQRLRQVKRIEGEPGKATQSKTSQGIGEKQHESKQ
jgi:hypothetical protein